LKDERRHEESSMSERSVVQSYFSFFLKIFQRFPTTVMVAAAAAAAAAAVYSTTMTG
jgi:hypothetical protein